MHGTSRSLGLVPYHSETIAYLKIEQSELWRWFSSNRVQEEQADAVRLELLKAAYRVDPESAPRLHGLAHEASQRLGLNVPITLYHSQRAGDGLNAMLAFLPEEIHIVLHGPLTDVLDDAELRALLGHELAHYLLWTGWDGAARVADQILESLAGDDAADTPQRESFRLFRLYAEIFCDRGARLACGELLPAVGALVKTETGVRDVNAASYLKQVEEISGRDASRTAEFTHPECYIRARALQRWDENASAAETEIRRMIEGEPALHELDLLAQRRVGKLTRRLVDALLANAGLQTDRLLGHARLFFDGYEPPAEAHRDESLADDLHTADPHLRDYYCYVLLDFVTTDRDLDDAPLAATMLMTERWDLADRFAEIVRKELNLGKKQFEKIRRDAGKIVAAAGQEAETT